MDNGNVITEAFCATCGSPIYVCSTGGSTRMPLKAGSFDAPTAVWASTQIWTRSAVTWHDTSLATEHHVAGVPPMENPKTESSINNRRHRETAPVHCRGRLGALRPWKTGDSFCERSEGRGSRFRRSLGQRRPRLERHGIPTRRLGRKRPSHFPDVLELRQAGWARWPAQPSAREVQGSKAPRPQFLPGS